MNNEFLLVGLGNPGVEYENTRHNLGFMVIDKIAEHKAISMKKQSEFRGILGKGIIGTATCFLLKPTTYMNLSGEAVSLVQRYYQVPTHQILVISDEVTVPFGELKLSESGGNRGHKGLKSIDAELGTQHYAKLRIGIGDREEGDLADHVLGKFQEEELAKLPMLIEQAAMLVESWVQRSTIKES